MFDVVGSEITRFSRLLACPESETVKTDSRCTGTSAADHRQLVSISFALLELLVGEILRFDGSIRLERGIIRPDVTWRVSSNKKSLQSDDAYVIGGIGRMLPSTL